MGVKRPLEEESLPELSLTQLDNSKKLALTAEDLPSDTTALEVDFPGEVKSSSYKLDFDGMLESGDAGGALEVDKELEASAPLSFVTSSSTSSWGEVENKDSSLCSSFCGYVDFDMPWQPPAQCVDACGSSRKKVPVGPDHQAEVPTWDSSASGKDFLGSNNLVDIEWEQKMMGTCIWPSPGLNASGIDGFVVGRGRTDCSCEDVGSMRCVQQHVKEAREKLREAIGDEAFTKLGFYEMGEEVACKWTANDENLFHDVVVNNPVSHGRDFWRHLNVVFPNRTKKELVSYYFNVFVLRRRGVQNRSFMLQIDSDDDEDPEVVYSDYRLSQPMPLDDAVDVDDLRFTRRCSQVIVGGDGGSEVESLSDQDLDAGWVVDLGSDHENFFYDAGSKGNHGTSDGNVPKKDAVDEGSCDNHVPCDDDVPKQDAGEMDGETEQVSGQETK